jgi:hypothetical protein
MTCKLFSLSSFWRVGAALGTLLPMSIPLIGLAQIEPLPVAWADSPLADDAHPAMQWRAMVSAAEPLLVFPEMSTDLENWEPAHASITVNDADGLVEVVARRIGADRRFFRARFTPLPPLPEGDRTVYIAPDGNDSNPGTEQRPFKTLTRAVNQAQPGDVIILRGGLYEHASTISIGTSRNGTAAKPVTVTAYPGEQPILDFSAQSTASGNIGVRLNASYWRIIGLTIRRAGHNGIRMDGSHNILERLVAYENRDTGIHMASRAAHNLVVDCDSFRNFNPGGRIGNNADGFGAKFEDLGPGNHFLRCRSWQNSDDGFDFWKSPSPIILEACWSFGNGDVTVFPVDPSVFEGAGNGFKLGGDYIPGDHIIIRSVAFNNKGKGFDHNNNTGLLTHIHNTAFANGRNFVFPNAPAAGGAHVFRNNLSLPATAVVQIPANSAATGNSWQLGFFSVAELVSTDPLFAAGPRQADGAPPHLELLRLRPDSALVDAGQPVPEGYGGPHAGAAPDVGAFEYGP